MPGTLILIPTAGELNVLKPRLTRLPDVNIQLVGFGPVAAAARTSLLIASLQPERIVLAGIAGAFTKQIPPGQAAIFEHVAMYGIGAGSGDAFRNAGELGWLHWQEAVDGQPPVRIGDAISLQQTADDTQPFHQLLTVCAAAATQKDVRDRIAKFPRAIAEDMEGFSVALSGAMAGVPTTIVRGISNIAGDREKSRWRIVDALNAAADVVLEILK